MGNGADSLVIRTAGKADIAAVRALLRETWHQVYDPILGAEAVEEVIARWHAPALLTAQLNAARSSFLVACDGDEVVGHGFGFVREPATLVVSRLYIVPSHQRRGIGRRLMAALAARHREARTLHLFAAAENARGLAFYRALGFTVVSEGVEEGARVLHLEKRLDPGDADLGT
jgi:ribosomal protein S18 acetylase RimI-like enzyme